MNEIEIRLHEDINDYREKFKGFTVRQWICGVIGIIINVPLYIYARSYLGDECAQWLVILIAVPFAIIGFIPIQNLDAEKMLPYLFRFYFQFAKPLPYKTELQIAEEKARKEAKKKQQLPWKWIYFVKKRSHDLLHQFKKSKKSMNSPEH